MEPTFLPEQVDPQCVTIDLKAKTSEATAENHFELWNTPSFLHGADGGIRYV